MNNLAHYREAKGFSQGELARRCGLDQGTISRVENGIRDFSGQEWKVIAKELECTVDELLGTNERK